MRPFTVNGDVWRVVLVEPSDPRLVDRLGFKSLGTTDPETRTVHLSSEMKPPLLDRVMLHEAAHAVTISHGLLGALRERLPPEHWVWAEEWACHLVETYGLEASELASEALGRPVCVRGFCYGRSEDGV